MEDEQIQLTISATGENATMSRRSDDLATGDNQRQWKAPCGSSVVGRSQRAVLQNIAEVERQAGLADNVATAIRLRRACLVAPS